MPRPMRNIDANIAAASQEVDNMARWGSIVLEKINKIVDKIQKQQYVDIEVEVPLGDNIAHLFGKEHLEIDGKIPVIRANLKVKISK